MKKNIFTFALFPVVFLYYEFAFKIMGNIPFDNMLVLTGFTLGTAFLFGTLQFFFPKKKSRWIYSEIIFVFTAIIFIIENFVGKAFQTFMTFESLLSAAGDAAGDFGSEIITTVISGWYMILIYFIPSILVAIFRKKLFYDVKRPLCFALSLFGAILAILFSHLGAESIPVYQNEYQYDASMRKLGVFSSFYNDFRHAKSEGDFIVTEPESDDSTEQEQALIEEEIIYPFNILDIDFATLAEDAPNEAIANLDRFLSTQSGTRQNEYTGLFKGKNLIFITAEAFSNFAINEALTPTLYRMAHNGFYFSDYYQPAWGGSTSTGEFSNLMGLIPTDGVYSIRNTEGHNLYQTIGNFHIREGYHTVAYHNNSYTYYSRNLTHGNLGYSSFIGMGNGMEEGVTNCWPQSDLEMINFTVPQYIDKQPFSVYYMTVSGHCGYSQSGNAMSKKNWEAVQSMENASSTIKAYQASQLELEYAMESLVTQLETAGILDDTVIVVASDHYPYGLEAGDTWGNDRNYLPELYGIEESELDQFTQDQNALIIWSACLENDLKDFAVEVNKPVYSLDILPTLCNLFGLKYDSRLFAGQDVFSNASPLVIWPNYSWKTDKAIYSSITGQVTLTTTENVSDEYIENIKNIVQNKFTLSQTTLSHDYWQHVFPIPANQ